MPLWPAKAIQALLSHWRLVLRLEAAVRKEAFANVLLGPCLQARAGMIQASPEGRSVVHPCRISSAKVAVVGAAAATITALAA